VEVRLRKSVKTFNFILPNLIAITLSFCVLHHLQLKNTALSLHIIEYFKRENQLDCILPNPAHSLATVFAFYLTFHFASNMLQ